MEIAVHEDQTARPGEFADYLKAKTPTKENVTPETVDAGRSDVDRQEVAETAGATAKPIDAFEDPETGEAIEKPTRGDKRIKRLWTERQDAIARAERAEQRLAALEGGQGAAGPAKPAGDTKEAAPEDALIAAAQSRIRSKPNRAEIGTTYATYEDYVEDCAIWGGELAAEKRAIQAERQAAEATLTEQQTKFGQDVGEARKVYEDFDEVTGRNLPTNQAMWDATINAPDGLKGHVLYYLGTHEAQTREIAAMPPAQAYMAMGEVIATVRAERAAKANGQASPQKPVSKAPASLPPSTRHSATVSSAEQIATSGGDPVAFIRMRNQERPRRM